MPKPKKEDLANLNKLNKIAAKTGKRLQQIPIENIMEWDSRYGYSCAEAGDVTGLNLRSSEIKDISFLTDFPGLTHLSLYDNKIADISPLMALIQKMEIKWEYKYGENGIFLAGNPLEIPPVEIVKKGKEAVLAYFASLGKEEILPLNEVKVLLVGDGAAGKTSLVKRLMDKGFDIDEAQTQGINIDDWHVEQSNKEIKVHLWDFGGVGGAHILRRHAARAAAPLLAGQNLETKG